MGIRITPCSNRSLFQRAFWGRQPQRQNAQVFAQRDKIKTREKDPEDGSSENYLGGEPFVLPVDLVWVSLISSIMRYVDKSNEDISTIFNLILDQ